MFTEELGRALVSLLLVAPGGLHIHRCADRHRCRCEHA